VERTASELLRNESPDYLAEVDFEEFLNHLVDRIAWELLEWNEGAMTMEPFISKQSLPDGMGGRLEMDQPKVRLRIPFSPHPRRSEFFKFTPPSQHSTGEPEWNFEGNMLVLEVRATEAAIAGALEEIRFWIGGRNNDIRSGNATLRERVESIWRRKRAELQTHRTTLQALTQRVKIPLHQSAEAPKPVPVAATKGPTQRPLLKPAVPEPELDRKEVLELVRFIESYVRQFEVTPEVYSKLQEEQLRDLVLSMLNVNYPGSSAETFSKRGKTDLFLRAGGGGSLIAECKRWSGSKRYSQSLDQLFGYLTWRHGFAVLLTFSTTKDMAATITSAREVIAAHPSTVTGSVVEEGSSRFTSRHIHPQDRGKVVEVFHLFVDLAV
jgi:hypothetical protein